MASSSLRCKPSTVGRVNQLCGNTDAHAATPSDCMFFYWQAFPTHAGPPAMCADWTCHVLQSVDRPLQRPEWQRS
jgi:hypothetical protein